MICLFNSTTSKSDLIETNGDYILNMLCTSAIITEELNGEYSFDGIFRISNTFPKALYDMLAEENILKIDEEYGTEYFRIAKVVKTTKNVTVFARHITISDTLTLWCEDVRPTKLNGSGAIAWIYDNAIGEKLLTLNSNIADTSTAYYVNKNVYEALFTADNSFLDRWGGEVYRRGFNLSINKNVGTDKGVTIRSKKNLTGFEATTTVDSLKTRIYPQGYNGITIDEKYIDSKYINNYARIYTSLEKFDDVKVNDENIDDGFATLSEAQEELKKRVQKMYEVNNVDLLTATYRVNFVELGKTEEYKNYSILEQTWLGDTIEVIEDNLGINISVRVLKRKYDVLKKKRTETELSNKNIKEKPPTIQQIITEIEKIPSVDNILQMAKDNATALIQSGLKNSHVIVRENEIIIGDTKDINTMVNVWRWNKGGLGFSNTGYYGQFGTAITQDGAIVADFITTGILNANLIRAGILKSFNQKTWINMEDGTFNFVDKIKFDGEKFTIDLTGEDLTTNESIKAEFQIMSDAIKSKVSNGEFQSYVEQTDKKIAAKVSNEEFESYKEQTAEYIKTEIKNTKEGLESNIQQTADSIKTEVNDTKKGLESKITQTAESLRSEYKDADKKLEGSITQTAESLRTEYKDIQKGLEGKIQVNAEAIKTKFSSADFESYKTQTAKYLELEFKNTKEGLESKITQTANSLKSDYTDKVNKISSTLTQTKDNLEAKITDAKNNLQSQITLNKNSISQKVESKDFQSYKTQTANEIASKVASKDLSTVVKQNAHSWGLSINGKLKGTNYTFDGENFTIGTTKGENTAYHSNDRSLWKHQDGGYTRVSANGLERYSAGEHRKYHYLMHGGTVQVTNSTWVSLPTHIANKVGNKYSVSISVRGYGFNDINTRALMQVYCAVLEKKADQFLIRVDLYGWKPEKGDWRGNQTIGGWVNVDYVIIA